LQGQKRKNNMKTLGLIALVTLFAGCTNGSTESEIVTTDTATVVADTLAVDSIIVVVDTTK